MGKVFDWDLTHLLISHFTSYSSPPRPLLPRLGGGVPW
jgi:hypothetical protein